jgi:catechol 2,3-dioxygenase-like lactoylglutathione lyase family enzyme
MHLNHLGLPVRGLQRSQQFYSAYFGFDPATARGSTGGGNLFAYVGRRTISGGRPARGMSAHFRTRLQCIDQPVA